jgi:ribosome modulation factor
MNKLDLNFMEAGRRANEAGNPRSDCHLAEGTVARNSWLQGWDDAQIDRELWEDENFHRAHQAQG